MNKLCLQIVAGTAVQAPAGSNGSGFVPSARDVRAEAERRLRAAGYDRMRARSLATGIEIPKTIAYLRMQIDFVAETLASLDAIPQDFRSDIYWPAIS